jgi:beta-mannosidase
MRRKKKRNKIIIAILSGLILPGLALAARMERGQARALADFQFIQVKKSGQKQVGDWMPAKVPGDVMTDLVGAGKLKHPYYDSNSKDALWVNDFDWLYQAEFSAIPGPDERVWILFHGIDYQSRGILNGREIFQHTGMFSRVFVDATGILKKDGLNQLQVELFGLKNRPHSPQYRVDQFLEQLKRRTVTKTQMSFGWDIAVELINAGLWDKVELFKTGPVMIEDIGVHTKNSGEVSLDLALDSNYSGNAVLKISVIPENFGDKKPVFTKEFSISLSSGKSTPNSQFLIPNPSLWWTWDLGDPNLYRVRAEVLVNGKTSDSLEETFGFREVAWEQNPGAQEGWKWVLKLNGNRLFMRGANWVPPDALLGQLSNEKYQRLINMARDANINIFRMWGGGNREWDIFYDQADRKGIMLWQEFPFACIYVPGYPTDKKFLNLVTQEVGEVVRSTRNHPSVVLYSGGNEFNVAQNKKVVERMRAQVNELSPERRFIGASPDEGDSHNWIVWHQKGNLTNYFSDQHALMSEFGIQALPYLRTIEQYISEDQRWPLTQKVYKHHDLEYGKLMKYVNVVPHKETLESYIDASQKMQAYYYQRAIEHWRIRKYRVSGTLFWMFDESWPGMVGSVVDYELKPKQAFEQMASSTYSPLLIAADLEVRTWKPGDDFSTDIYLVNDYDRKFSQFKVQAFINDKLVGEWMADAGPDSSQKIATLNYKLPPGASPLLVLQVSGAEHSQNIYDLSNCDSKPANSSGRAVQDFINKIVFGDKP